MTDNLLLREAETHATELNLLNPSVVTEWLVDLSSECPYWDSRTNLLSVVADDPEDAAVVLSDPDNGDCVVIRRVGEWIVDSDPVDWEEVAEAATAGD